MHLGILVCHKFLDIFIILNKPHMVILNVCYYSHFLFFIASLLLRPILQIKQFKQCVIHVSTIMHLDTHSLKFEFLDYNNVKSFKSKFSINLDFVSTIYFLI
jgi:hypothetical protein